MRKNEFIYGLHAVEEKLLSGSGIDKILIKRDLNSPLARTIVFEARKQNIPVQYVPIEKLNKITTANHQGIIALNALVEYVNVESILPTIYEKGEDPFFLILDGITDTRNIGAIARTAECCGCHAIIIPEKGQGRITPESVKTSAGALNHIPVCRVKDLKSVVKFLKDSGLSIVGATEKTDKLIYDLDFKAPVCIIMGSEETGISNTMLQQCDDTGKIPMFGNISSLNVSVAASILMYEAIRQRHKF